MLHIDHRGPVTLVTLDRPERRNALDAGTCDELARAVSEAVGVGARAIVLAGAGPHFCAGADLSGVEDAEFAGSLRAALQTLATAPVATIAAVQGAALGAGAQLAVGCDLRVAEATARFGIPAAKLGLMVDHWTVQRLATIAGQGPARAMLLAAEEVDGLSAHRVGMVQRIGGLDEALAWAAEIATLAPLTIAGHKLSLNALEQTGSEHPGVRESFRAAWASADLVEGMAARNERRPPRFQGS